MDKDIYAFISSRPIVNHKISSPARRKPMGALESGRDRQGAFEFSYLLHILG